MERRGFRIIQRREGLRPDLGKLSSDAERVYWRLMLACDEHGCHRGESNAILGDVLIGTKLSKQKVDNAVSELVAANIVSVWDADDDARWLEIVDFDLGQTANFLHRRDPRIAPPNPNLDPVDALAILEARKAEKPVDEHWSEDTRSDVRKVFDAWVAGELATDGVTKAQLTDARKKQIKGRLDDGYSVDDLLAAIDGYHLSPWHLGKNDRQARYTGIDLIMRDAAKVEAGIQRAKKLRGQKQRFSEYDK